ncbi:carbohydrate kinase [Synechococcus sp. M16CYN]|uniref:carbohydrate kinase family protein n=1 Tax=Synechococcus sp. M16CYN TaxID=3103139 RepID=UPI00333F5B52
MGLLKTKTILCLGEALVDRLGPLGGDPSQDRPVNDQLGGAPANVACGLARLGTPVVFAGRLGLDPIGDAFCQLFDERHIDTTCLQRDQQRPSRIVLVRRSLKGERLFQGFINNWGLGFADQALTKQALPRVSWLLIGTIPLASPASASALRAALQEMRCRDTAIALDVNWRPTFWNTTADPAAGPQPEQISLISPLLQQASLIKLAREEALWFFSTDRPTVISRALPRHPDVVVTDGAKPIHWFLNGVTGMQPAFRPKQVVDTTGAGDAFMAGLLHRWQSPPTERVRFAAACGALVCGGTGAIDPQPTDNEVGLFLNQQKHY